LLDFKVQILLGSEYLKPSLIMLPVIIRQYEQLGLVTQRISVCVIVPASSSLARP